MKSLRATKERWLNMKTPIFLQIPVGPNEKPFSLCNGKSPDSLRVLPDSSIDCIITDPPYGINYNNNEWDISVPCLNVWLENYRLLKPGGYLISFIAKRTAHQLATAVENAGFKMKDQILWFHGQGAPKTEKLAEKLKLAGANKKVIQLFGNYRGDLRPLYEPILIFQKPIDSPNLATNLIKHGTGVINSASDFENGYVGDIIASTEDFVVHFLDDKGSGIKIIPTVLSFSRASKKERRENLEDLIFDGATKERPKTSGYANEEITNGLNFHPTVKPLALMKYLVELFSIPGAVILDPFMGSGTTGVGALLANRRFIGVEMNEHYFSIAKERLEKSAQIIPHNPNDMTVSIQQNLNDNVGLIFLKEIHPKIKSGTASTDDIRMYCELLEKFGPLPLVA